MHSRAPGTVDQRRVFPLNDALPRPGPVVYWMSRDQRVSDNWALLYARELALGFRAPLAVVFCLLPGFLGATMRQYGFMLNGLAETENELRSKGIPFFLLTGRPELEIPRFIKTHKVAALVTDFDPLRIKLGWKDAVARKIGIPFHEVDAHNIVPCRFVSDKLEYGAYTLRPKIKRHLPEFLTLLPKLARHPHSWPGRTQATDWEAAERSIRADCSVSEVDWMKPGGRAGSASLRRFIGDRLDIYAAKANDPNGDAQSELSPYLHFGQLSAQRVALEVAACGAVDESKAVFLEQLIVRRELSDNFCLHNPKYDSIEGIPRWARETLDAHRNDTREYVYSRDAFESARTRDPLWNAAQMQMMKTGKMHGYMRMYWAKKILEWSANPEDAYATAIYLNDRFELDGRDPNGYTGIAWSIGGVHDRPWRERPVLGKIRYMSYAGCRKKFDVDAYIRRISDMT